MQRFLEFTYFLNGNNQKVQSYAFDTIKMGDTDLEKAKALYYRVRDDFQYTAYEIDLKPEAWRASDLLERPIPKGNCIEKSVLLATCARIAGIPSRLLFADVKNHIAAEKIEALLGTDILSFHGYLELFLEGKWVAATPAFNKELCELYKVAPLEFDGKNDSVFQSFNQNEEKFMEYLKFHGRFHEFPYDLFIASFHKHYGRFVKIENGETTFSLT